MTHRRQYHEQLETAQKGSLAITDWLSWLLSVLEDALNQGLLRFEQVVHRTRFWQQHSQAVLTACLIKVLNRLLYERGEILAPGINASKYMGLARVSKATPIRVLKDLLAKGCLRKLPGGGAFSFYLSFLSHGDRRPSMALTAFNPKTTLK